MRVRNAVLSMMIAVSSVGCSTVESVGPNPSGTADRAETLAVTRPGPEERALTYYSGLTQPTRLVIRDEAAWVEVWEQIWASLSPVPARPTVDFTRSVVVVAGMGTRSSGGYDIRILGAQLTGGNLEITVRSEHPAPGCPVTAALTNPVDVAIVSRSADAFIFVEESSIRTCD